MGLGKVVMLWGLAGLLTLLLVRELVDEVVRQHIEAQQRQFPHLGPPPHSFVTTARLITAAMAVICWPVVLVSFLSGFRGW